MACATGLCRWLFLFQVYIPGPLSCILVMLVASTLACYLNVVAPTTIAWGTLLDCILSSNSQFTYTVPPLQSWLSQPTKSCPLMKAQFRPRHPQRWSFCYNTLAICSQSKILQLGISVNSLWSCWYVRCRSHYAFFCIWCWLWGRGAPLLPILILAFCQSTVLGLEYTLGVIQGHSIDFHCGHTIEFMSSEGSLMPRGVSVVTGTVHGDLYQQLHCSIVPNRRPSVEMYVQCFDPGIVFSTGACGCPQIVQVGCNPKKRFVAWMHHNFAQRMHIFMDSSSPVPTILSNGERVGSFLVLQLQNGGLFLPSLVKGPVTARYICFFYALPALLRIILVLLWLFGCFMMLLRGSLTPTNRGRTENQCSNAQGDIYNADYQLDQSATNGIPSAAKIFLLLFLPVKGVLLFPVVHGDYTQYSLSSSYVCLGALALQLFHYEDKFIPVPFWAAVMATVSMDYFEGYLAHGLTGTRVSNTTVVIVCCSTLGP